MSTMACFAATLGVVILSGFINISAANKDTCELNAVVGHSLTLPFVYVGLAKSNVLRWTHNSTIIFLREQGRVSFGKPEDVSASGSLLLKNLQFASAGIYQANVLHPNNTAATAWVVRLCVMEKVPKPKLAFTCDFKSSAVNLNCNVAKPQDFMFSWTLDGKTLTSETRQTLSISLAQLKGERSFTCAVANKVSKENSDTVRPTCKKPSPTPPTLHCFPSKTIAAVTAGGSGLILLLLIIIIVLCCCRRRSKTQMRLRDEGEFRMRSVNKGDPDSTSREYETMHQTEDSYDTQAQPQAQAENLPPQLSTLSVEGQQPSPVPMPRTKNPQATNI